MSRTSWIPLAIILLAVARGGWAQEADENGNRQPPFPGPTGQVATSGMVAPTVEMWFYEQELRRHDDPKVAVRRKAELRAQQRQDRIAASKWYGIDNSRPMVSPTPAVTGYSQHWGSNSYDPLRWRPIAPTIIVSRPNEGRY